MRRHIRIVVYWRSWQKRVVDGRTSSKTAGSSSVFFLSFLPGHPSFLLLMGMRRRGSRRWEKAEPPCPDTFRPQTWHEARACVMSSETETATAGVNRREFSFFIFFFFSPSFLLWLYTMFNMLVP